ncbi:Fur-regulated basic protein FbpA [Bacillus sonorensis]|uniref:Fur-regulated basic protein FbpA n=2 Tax=Bacillus sonorensis TaxID=119858 RepID=M5P1X7_9BACI|nr:MULTISPECIES: Fur-regulated basic protein FbpA [Bacillus]TWK75246.1 hypothetical protein CHCC20335_0978 [Bacillus paralicheniformis]EME74071.1 hypothetical protein BSONL12_13941 [Bacillus sonorensis L12]MCF7619763.1 Fur-regulated basic protein FbpA [Bacillus sonorensis]MCY7858387.1 Fur-regulated basic protein FbpA [Bacillus sonorensis]MCY8027498.1 Fur-regulated basic protein FbpA [Bacillus sonorensis]
MQIIQRFIQLGIYKKAERHLYELSLNELESEYESIKRRKADNHVKTKN